MSHGLKVAHPVVKLLNKVEVWNDGVDHPERQHDKRHEADEEPPGEIVGAQQLQQVRLARDPGTDHPDVVVTIVIQPKFVLIRT